MKKLSSKTFFLVNRTSGSKAIVIGNNYFIVYDCNKYEILFESPRIKNICVALYNENRGFLFTVDTSGKVIVLNKMQIKSNVRLLEDSKYYNMFSKDNEVYCISSQNNIIVLNEFGVKILDVPGTKNIDAIIQIGEKVYFNKLTRKSPNDSLDVVSELYECRVDTKSFGYCVSVYKDYGFAEKFKVDLNEKSFGFLMDKAKGCGRNYELVILYPENSTYPHIYDLDDIQKKIGIKSFLIDYDINIDFNLLALLWYDEFVIWDYVNEQVVYRKKFKKGKDVAWITNNKLLVTSYVGLFEINLDEHQSGDGSVIEP